MHNFKGMKEMKQDILNLNNEIVGTVELDKSIFGLEVRSDILQRVVRWQLAKAQSGNHKTKGRSEVSRSGSKPFKQKGTGRARQGDRKAPHMTGGGIAFGPVVRSHAHDLTKKFRALGLKTALSSKAQAGLLVVVDNIKVVTPKTKELKTILDKAGYNNCLFIDGKDIDMNFALASRNIFNVDVLPTIGANVYDILRREKLVLTKDAIACLEARFK